MQSEADHLREIIAALTERAEKAEASVARLAAALRGASLGLLSACGTLGHAVDAGVPNAVEVRDILRALAVDVIATLAAHDAGGKKEGGET